MLVLAGRWQIKSLHQKKPVLFLFHRHDSSSPSRSIEPQSLFRTQFFLTDQDCLCQPNCAPKCDLTDTVKFGDFSLLVLKNFPRRNTSTVRFLMVLILNSLVRHKPSNRDNHRNIGKTVVRQDESFRSYGSGFQKVRDRFKFPNRILAIAFPFSSNPRINQRDAYKPITYPCYHITC